MKKLKIKLNFKKEILALRGADYKTTPRTAID